MTAERKGRKLVVTLSGEGVDDTLKEAVRQALKDLR